MNDITPRKIKTGVDPRTLADYAALRDEMSKLLYLSLTYRGDS